MASTRFGIVARQFSTSSSREALVKAPIQLFGLEGRYAHALYSAANKQKQLDAVEKELNAFQALCQKDVKLAEFIANPTIKKQTKQAVLEDVLKKKKASPVTANFLGAMAENGRLQKMNSIINAFNTIMSAHRGEVICSITTAKALDAAQLKEAQAALQLFLKKGETINLTTKVDPTIIGGMVVNIGDKYVDMSMATKIKAYHNLIKEAI